MHPSSPTSSLFPLKTQEMPGPDAVNQDDLQKAGADEKAAAAAALASLSASSNVASTMEKIKIFPIDESDGGNRSDSEASYSSQNSVLPKAVHTPPQNSMMVDHKYTDYSVIDEISLSFLEDGIKCQSKLSEEEKKVNARRVLKIKSIFGDVGPSKKNSGGVVKPFPAKLMEVLDRPDMETIITWMPHGRAFVVLQPQQLRDNVLPRFFKQTKFMSFTRQLNLWGYKRITKGDDSGAYYHELFLRGRSRLAMLMRRQKIKGTGIKLTPNPATEPNFYKISEKRPLPAIDPSKWKNKPLPPLRHNPQARNYDLSPSTIGFNRMAQRMNSRPDRQEFEQQGYPFNNNSSNLAAVLANANNRGNSFSGLSAAQGMNHRFNASLNQNSLAASEAARGLNGNGLNGSMNDNFALQQLLLRQQFQQSNYHSGLATSQGALSNGMNSISNGSQSLQQLLLRQQFQPDSLREANQEHLQIAAAQRLLSQVNGPPPSASSMGNSSLHILELKRRLLNAANSLGGINQQEQQQQQQQQQDPLYQQLSSNSMLASLLAKQQQQHRQQQQPQNNSTDINTLLRALEHQAGTSGHIHSNFGNYGDNRDKRNPF